MTKRFEIQHKMLSGWENTWTDDNGSVTFATIEEANTALKEYLQEDWADTEHTPFDPDDFRVTAVVTP